MKHIGKDIKAEPANTQDTHDPFQGGFGVRGKELVGTVVSTKSAKTVTVQLVRKIMNQKYKRTSTRTYKVRAHNPDSIDAKDGDTVRIIETRPISKTKHFCVVEVVGGKQ